MITHEISAASLLRSILFQRLGWRVLILFLALIAALLGILAPYAQKHFADVLFHGGAAGDAVGGAMGGDGHSATFWVWSAFFLTLGAQGFSQLGMWLAMRESLITQKALGDTAYSRILEGPGGLIGRRPAGEAVSLFAVDVPGATALLDQALVMACSMVFPLLLTPIALHRFFGISWSVSFGTIIGIGLVNFVLARRQSRFFHRFKDLAAERTGLVAEWIHNIRALRILGWVRAAEKRLIEVRRRETRNRKEMVTNAQIMNALATSSTFALNIVAISLLVRTRGPEHPVSPGDLLSLLWILGVFLARPLRQFPWVFVMGLDSLSSISRLQKAMDLPISLPRVDEPAGTPTEGDWAIEVRALRFEVDGRALLKDVDLCVRPGELVAVVGEVGSGKSLLLQSLMGATGARFARFALDGVSSEGPRNPRIRERLAYVPQEGFTMSATLRENVVFRYREGNEEIDQEVLASLRVAQFTPEKERISDGLDTEIGERGVNLSGGQRQRIGLARAHFADRRIILMDDCLSAVDVDTEKRLVAELIRGAWRDRTRILVTHRLAVLPECDRVLFMEDGAVVAQGTYSQLLERSDRFREFVRREFKKEEEGERTSPGFVKPDVEEASYEE